MIGNQFVILCVCVSKIYVHCIFLHDLLTQPYLRGARTTKKQTKKKKEQYQDISITIDTIPFYITTDLANPLFD